ncbi:MAG: hypothetical protein DMG53_00180 [Acidobacteria bacterium]|nr:MAG: hypothetical protein DMG53_00180 [Acidobacteriota bacterium]
MPLDLFVRPLNFNKEFFDLCFKLRLFLGQFGYSQITHGFYLRDIAYIGYSQYFNGDARVVIGASHQTGWTGLVAKLIEQSGE